MNSEDLSIGRDVVHRLLSESGTFLTQSALNALSESSQEAFTVGFQGPEWARSLETAYSIRRSQGAEVKGLEETVDAISSQSGKVAAFAIAGSASVYLVVCSEDLQRLIGVVCASRAG